MLLIIFGMLRFLFEMGSFYFLHGMLPVPLLGLGISACIIMFHHGEGECKVLIKIMLLLTIT